MKTKLTLFIALLTFVFTSEAQIKTPQPSPFAKVEQKAGLTDITLEYSRPSKRGRIIFGDLVPYGKHWRTGANANTKISFSTDVSINGKTLKKGTYALYTVPNQKQWEVIFYKDHDNWGLPQKWDNGKIALSVSANVHSLPEYVETFTISLDDLADPNYVTMNIKWDAVRVPVKIMVPSDKIALESIEKVMSGPSAQDYYAAASFYHRTGKNLDKALAWINKAIEGSPKAYWMYREKALILYDKGDKKAAIEAAKKAKDVAQAAGAENYVKMNQESIDLWSK